MSDRALAVSWALHKHSFNPVQKFLSNKSHCIKMGETGSEYVNMHWGQPQASVQWRSTNLLADETNKIYTTARKPSPSNVTAPAIGQTKDRSKEDNALMNAPKTAIIPNTSCKNRKQFMETIGIGKAILTPVESRNWYWLSIESVLSLAKAESYWNYPINKTRLTGLIRRQGISQALVGGMVAW